MKAFDKNEQEKAVNDILTGLFGAAFMEAMKDSADDNKEDVSTKYDDMAIDFKAMYDSFVKAGFDKDQAFVLLNTFIEGAAAGFKK